MSGGILQLVAKGIETIYLVENPQITMFKIVYRRHTNFSTFDSILHFKKKLKLGGREIYKLRNIADILYNLVLVIDLPDINISFEKPTAYYIKKLLAEHGISWSASSDTTLVTRDIYDTEIKDLILYSISAITQKYSDANNLLSIIDKHYGLGPDIYQGEYFLINYENVDFKRIAIDLDSIGVNIHGRTAPGIDESNNIYVFVNTSNFDIDNDDITLIPDRDIAVNGNYSYVTSDYLASELGNSGPEYIYAAIRLNALSGDKSIEQTLSIAGNIYMNGDTVALFKYKQSTNLVRSVPYNNVFKNNDDTLALFNNYPDEFDNIYFLYDTDGIVLTDDMIIDLDNSRVLSDGDDNTIYCSRQYLDNYIADNGESGTYIAINRYLYMYLDGTSTLVNLPTYAYKHSLSPSYSNFPNTCITETEKFYCLVSEKSILDEVVPSFFPFWGERGHIHLNIVSNDVSIISESTLKRDTTVTISDAELKTYTYIGDNGDEFDFVERVDLENLEYSKYSSTHKYAAIKKTSVNIDGNTLTFPKSDIARGIVPNRYNYYTEHIIREDTLIEKTVELSDKYGSNKIDHIYNNVKNYDGSLTLVEHPYIFMVKILKYAFLLDTSHAINHIAYTGLLALMDDVGEDVDRNIIMENMINIRVLMYSKFVAQIFNIEKVYGNFLLSYTDPNITDGLVVNWPDPTTGPYLNKTIVVSKSKENIQFIHSIDMANYSNIPIKSTSISTYYDYIINSSYNNTSRYSELDAYIIYQNYINEIKKSGIISVPTFGYYDSVTLENTARNITTSISNNYKSNSEMLYQIILLLKKIKIGLSGSAIHTAVVYTNTSINTTDSHQVTYGLLKSDNDYRHNVNIVKDVIRVAIDNNTQIYFKTLISTLFDNFLESVRVISSDSVMRSYFDKLIYWNECLTDSIIPYISFTSMNRTLAINNRSTYTSVFGTKRIILNHIPYALLQNIPYTIRKIIIEGGMFNINSEVFAFPSIYGEVNMTRFKNVLASYLSLELYDAEFVNNYKDGANNDINKMTIMEEFEEYMFNMVLGSVVSDTTTFYNSDYFNSLTSSDDPVDTYYVISPFTIEVVGSMDEDTNLGFLAENNLTAVEYVVKKFKRIYKKILNDFVEFVNNGYFTDSDGVPQTISDLTDGTFITITFSFVEDIYNYICQVLDGFMSGSVVDESVYSRTYSLFTNSQIFTNIRENDESTSHNHRFLDIQSTMWDIIQKRNIRAFNELMYNGLLSRNVLKTIGGTNILSYYDTFINIVANNNTPIYTDEYTDTNNVVHEKNYNINYNDTTPVGETGIDFYRLRLDSEYDTILGKLGADINYFEYLMESRYNKLKKILNIKYINLYQRNHLYNSVEEIIKQLSTELINKYNIKQDTNAGAMIDIIGFEPGQTYVDFTNVAKDIYDNKYSALDILKSGGDGLLNSGDNIYDIISKINGATTNPYDASNQHLYEWFETYNNGSVMSDVYNYFETLISDISPSVLMTHAKKNTHFRGYVRYTDVILFILDKILTTTISVSGLYNSLNHEYTNVSDIYNNITQTLINIIESNGDKIFNALTFGDGSIVYKTNDTAIVNDDMRYYRYKVFSMDDLTVEGTKLETKILNVLSQEKPNFKYVKNLGHRIIDYVSISYGAQELDRHTGELLDHIASITVTPEQLSGYNKMIGNTQEMSAYNANQKPIKRLYIPFRFFCCGDVSSGLPLLNLLYTDILINIKLNELSDILITDPGVYFTNTPKIKCHMIGSFVYLDESERAVMARSRLEFLIRRYQYNGDYVFSKKDIYQDNKIRIRPRFSDPSKYLYWKMCYEKMGVPNDKDDWYNMELKNSNGEIVKSMDLCKIKFNGETREDYKCYDYYNVYHPYTRKIYNMGMGNFVYSFAFNPLAFQPSGSASLGNIHDLTIIVKLHPEAVNALNNSNYRIIWKVWSYGMNIVAVISGIGGLRYFGN